jgi:hypothetical protein
MTPVLRYPQGPVTPHGAFHIAHNRLPQVAYLSYDATSVFNMMGGLAIADPMLPECVQIKDIKGLIPPWTNIEQKGATEDGASYISSLYDSMDVDLTVVARGRSPEMCRQVVHDWIAAWDAKRPGQLSWFTHDQGYWWAPVQWANKPTDALAGPPTLRQQFTWNAKAYSAFWQTYDSTALFKLTYGTFTSSFSTDTVSELGPNWDCTYSGSGGGWIAISNHIAYWHDDPAHPIGSGGRTVVCRPHVIFATDLQVASLTLGWFPEWSYPDNAFDDIWLRIPQSGALAGTPDGLRLRIGLGELRLSYFIGGVETLLRDQFLPVPPVPGDTFTLVAGYEWAPRYYTVKRNGITIMSVAEPGTGSPMGSTQRGAAFGMHAGGAVLTQATPAAVAKFTAADHGLSGDPISSQSGFIQRTNVGDQPMFDRYTCFGPGMFYFADGPGSSTNVAFGPLLPGQIVQLRTDPRKRGVVDLTPGGAAAIPVQQSNAVTQALADFISFATGNNAPPLLLAIESALGVIPPQGNLYALLHGRWSDAAAIPPRPAAGPVTPYYVAVGISGGNADSAILAAGTPLRRWPQ